MRAMGKRQGMVALVALGLLATMVPAGAAPNEDNQPAAAPADYDASAWRGWMTSAATDRVHDIAQIGRTVYVAGTFAGIRPTRTGTVTNRAHLAAFDAVTGAPVPGFAPVLDGTVHALEPSADGTRLYIAGAFTTLNGTNRGRLAAVDPATGATVANAVPNVGGTIRSIVLRGTTLYLGGNFTTVAGVARNRLAAINVTTGALSPTWRPTAEGNAVLTLEMAPDGSRLYAGGRFSSINGQTARAWIAALDPVTGAIQTGFSAQPGREVFDLLADGRGLVWAALGGALGRADVYRAVDGSLLTRHETEGDVQSVEEVGGLVYFGGHDIGPSGNEHLGVVDPAAPAILDAARFDEPSTGGDGVWALHSTGTDLWLGGNVGNPWFGFTRHPSVASPLPRTEILPVLSPWRYLDQAAAPAGWRTVGFDDSAWASGVAELGFGDTGEGTVLASGRTTYYFRRTFTGTDVGTLGGLRLDLLADDGAAVYVNGTEVARTNLPTGTLTDTTRAPVGLAGNAEDTFVPFAVPGSVLVEGTNTIAVEVHQNAAASSDLSFDLRLSAVRDGDAPPPPPPPTPVDVVVRGAQWRYRDGGAEPAAAWNQVGFDAGAWPEAPALFGREEGGEATVLSPGTGARWFRRTFAVADADAVTALRLDLVADDGAVAHLNGVEVVRDNVAPGPLTATTLAATYRTGVAERAVRSFSVPPSALVDGVNVLAVSLYQASGSSDASFDASLTATGATVDAAAPTLPTALTSPAVTASSIDVSWAAAADDIAVDHYDVFVGGALAATVATTQATISGLAPATTYPVAVEAVDAAGNRSGRTPDLLVTTADGVPPPPPPLPAMELVAVGATWRYRNAGTSPPADWPQPGFDDSTWLSGPAKLGREEGDEATVMTPGTGARWFRRTFTLAEAARVASLFIDLVADDGAVVYLNGTEVVRDNLPTGVLTDATLAPTYRTGTAEATRRTFSLPTSALVEGQNVVAVRVHQASGSTDVSFAARLRTGA